MLQADETGSRLVEAGDAVEHRGLAGAVRSDERGDVAAPGDERQVVDRDQAAKSHGEVLDPQDGLGWAHVLRSPSVSDGSRVETRPRGRQTMISTMAKPNTSMR